jgi:hypothetical protein
MPNFSDENGRYWWTPDGAAWYDRIEVLHPPMRVRKGCPCAFCENERLKKPKRKRKVKTMKVTSQTTYQFTIKDLQKLLENSIGDICAKDNVTVSFNVAPMKEDHDFGGYPNYELVSATVVVKHDV